MFYSQYTVYSTQQLGSNRITTTPLRRRITDNHVSFLNVKLKQKSSYVTIVNEAHDTRIFVCTLDNLFFINDSRVSDETGKRMDNKTLLKL
jgi:hypothetical protein